MKSLKPALERKIETLRQPFAEFISAQTTAGAALFFALVLSLVFANSPLFGVLHGIQHFRLGIALGEQTFETDLLHFVNDGLIAIFFFVIGLEVKRELLAGELRDGKRIRLLLGAATGGMAIPALVYVGINLLGHEGYLHGWGIPMATDTAIAIAILALLKGRVPRTVVAFLVGLAIIDDIGAISVIAVFYTQSLAFQPFLVAVGIFAALLVANAAGLRNPYPYVLGGILLWAAVVESGIHASLAGVIVAATVPARPRIMPGEVKTEVRRAAARLSKKTPPEEVLANQEEHERIFEVEQVAQDGTTPLRRWEHALGLPVALLILPLFVFVNAGIELSVENFSEVFSNPVAMGVLCGLVVGKPAGILLGVWLVERAGWSRRPEAMTNRMLIGIGLLAGIGFTMSTFIANLALETQDGTLDHVKLSIILASVIAAIAGVVALRGADQPSTGVNG